MIKRASQLEATYGPQEYKCFEGALEALFKEELPQLAGVRSRQAIVQAIADLVTQFYPATQHLNQGQIKWVTVDKNEKASYGKKIQNTRLVPVVLDLVKTQDITARKQGKKLRDIKIDAVARLMTQAYQQGGCLTNAETAILLKISPTTVGKYIKEWQQLNQKQLPRRGTIHDMGPSLTHKREIIERLFLKGQPVARVCRETYHSPEAVHRYIVAFKQVLLCRQKGLTNQEIAFAVKMSERLVKEYQDLIDDFIQQHAGLAMLMQSVEENLKIH